MKMIFPQKSGRVTFLHLLSSNIMPSFGKILRREIPDFVLTHGGLSQVLAQLLKLRTATCLKAQISTLVTSKLTNLQTIKPLDFTINKPL